MIRDLQINVTFLYLLKTSFPQKSLNSVHFREDCCQKEKIIEENCWKFPIFAMFDIRDIQCVSEKISVRIESV